MKVLYDYQIFVAQRFGGISRYFVELLKNIESKQGVSTHLEVVGNTNYYLPNKYSGEFSFIEKLKKYHRRAQKINSRNQRSTLKQLRSDTIDIFHPTYYDPYFIDALKKPLVITVHDMIYENFAELFPPNDLIALHKRLQIQKADKIIAVSQQTKEDILKHYRISESKIDVVHHGIDLTIPSVYEDIPDLPKDYILYVGGRYGYKNFQLLVQAFSTIVNRYDNLRLVVAGSPLGVAERELLYRRNVLDKVTVIPASDEQLNTLYKKALFFVYPSIYEGFGLPILEAYKNECPVLLSNGSCFPEVAGTAAAYFETFSVESLVEQMSILLESPTERAGFIEKGKEKLSRYSIDTCVDNTIKTYQSLL